MSLIPDITELLARARADLRMGVPVVLMDDTGFGVLAASAETISPQRLADLRGLCGDPVVTMHAFCLQRSWFRSKTEEHLPQATA